MTIHFAPLQGYTDDVYLSCHRDVYGGGYTCYTPFIRLEKGEPRHQDIRRFERVMAHGLDIVPQIIFKSVEEFVALVNGVKDKGAKRIDLNLGCPYPMQTRKGRGASMISNTEVMKDVSKLIAEDKDVSYSVKMRLGINSTDEWKSVLPILNDTPLAYVTMHPRIAAQMYGGELYIDSFAEFVSQSSHPVVYNGDLYSLEDIRKITDGFPALQGVMVGRGMLARPSLIAEWQAGREFSRQERMEYLRSFHDSVFSEYEATLCGQAQILQKIKPFWDYLEPEVGRKALKAINKSTSIDKYRNAVEPIFMFS